MLGLRKSSKLSSDRGLLLDRAVDTVWSVLSIPALYCTMSKWLSRSMPGGAGFRRFPKISTPLSICAFTWGMFSPEESRQVRLTLAELNC